MRKTTVWIVSLLLLAAVSGTAWWWMTRETAPSWRIAPVTRGPVEVTVTATGSLQAITTVEVGTQVSGTIAALYVDFNDRVTRGQIIARLDTTLLTAALHDAQSSQERVAALAQQAKAGLTRARSLFARELISRAELEEAEASARVAAANLGSANAQVERARINLRYAIIESPIDGIVLSRAVELGQTVAASFNTPTLFTLAGDMKVMRVQAAVDEADIGRLRAGQTATFTVDAYPDTSFLGTVEQVRLLPSVTQNVVTYDVILRAANPDLRLMPGMTANLSIVTDRRENVLLVPVAALRFTPPTQEKPVRLVHSSENEHVFILENDIPKPIRVKTGLTDGIRTEIEGPVEAGTEVVLGIATTASGSPAGGAPFGMQPRRSKNGVRH